MRGRTTARRPGDVYRGRKGRHEALSDEVDPDRGETLRHLLVLHRSDLRTRLQSLREATPADGPLVKVKDDEEKGLDDLIIHVDVALAEIGAASLNAIEEALRRLAEGIYGICTDCGGAIGSSRLAAVPFAIRCLRCQEAKESLRTREGSSERMQLWS